MGEAVLDRRPSDSEYAIGFLLVGGELVGAAGVEAGDDHGVTYVVVQAAEAEVREGPEAGGAQVGQDVVVAGGGVVVRAAGPGGTPASRGRYALVGQPETLVILERMEAVPFLLRSLWENQEEIILLEDLEFAWGPSIRLNR